MRSQIPSQNFFFTTQKISINFSSAPIRSEADDISLFIINFEDLSGDPPQETQPDEDEPAKQLTKCKNSFHEFSMTIFYRFSFSFLS